jgi:serine/threonine-protein kinase
MNDASLPAQRVGPYELIRRIGKGGMAEVFLARRSGIEGFQHECVVKTILPHYADDPAFAEMFFDEARITVELQHPNVVRVFDLDREGSLIYQAMEYVEGMDVLSLLVECEERELTVPFAAVLYIVTETLKGLHYAHNATDKQGSPLGLIHRDISPGNIMLGSSGAVKLGDFGVARARISKHSEEPGMLVGKLRYFAPELLETGKFSTGSDVFALGTCLYEMLSMEPLFPPAKDSTEQQRLMRAWDPAQTIEGKLGWPEGMDEILMRALAKDPDQRYPNALEFLEDVTDLAHESGIRLGDIAMTRFVQGLRRKMHEDGADGGDGGQRFRAESRRPRPPLPSATQQTRAGVRAARRTAAIRRRDQRTSLAEALAAPQSMLTGVPVGFSPTLELDGASTVELFTEGGRQGPFPSDQVQQAAAYARMSGLELISVDGQPWVPLGRYAPGSAFDLDTRSRTFDLLSAGPMLLGWASAGSKFESILWADMTAIYLAVAGHRLIALATTPPLEGDGDGAALAPVLRMAGGRAAATPSADLPTTSAAPLLAGVLIEAVRHSFPEEQLLALARARGQFHIQMVVEAMSDSGELLEIEPHIPKPLRRGSVRVADLQPVDAVAAMVLVILGLSRAAGER